MFCRLIEINLSVEYSLPKGWATRIVLVTLVFYWAGVTIVVLQL